MKKLCFVIMGYGKKTDPTLGKTFDLDITYNNIIKPAVIKAGYDCVRGDEILESGIIDKYVCSSDTCRFSNCGYHDIQPPAPRRVPYKKLRKCL